MQKASVDKGKRSILIIAYLTFIFELISISLAVYSNTLNLVMILVTVARIVVELSSLALMYNGKNYARFLIGGVFILMVLNNIYIMFALKPLLVTSQLVITGLLILIQIAITVYPFIAKDISGYTTYTSQYDNLEWVWCWSGKCFGYIDRDELWSVSGQFAGLIIENNEIYNEEGKYIGEIYTNGRLVTDETKLDKTIEPYNKPDSRPAFEPKENTLKMQLYNNYRDFSI